MGFFDEIGKARDNYEKRQKIDEYNYRAREYASEGQNIYAGAYQKLVDACVKVQIKVNDYQRYKQKLLSEINRTLKSIDGAHSEYKLSSNVDLLSLEACAVSGGENLGVVDEMLATWTQPSLGDFFNDYSSDVYSAKANMSQAKAYKERMKAKREELRNAKEAVLSIPDFMYEEQKQVDSLMEKFRKTAENINASNTKERTDTLCEIAKLIADSMNTQFIDNNYQITNQYKQISSRISSINDSIAGSAWLIGG